MKRVCARSFLLLSSARNGMAAGRCTARAERPSRPLTEERYNSLTNYIVTSDKMELKRGTIFTTLPNIPVERGDLALFKVSGKPIIGRSYLGVDGAGWIELPGRQIVLSDEPVEVIGRVVQVEPLAFKPISDLPESEYSQFFDNPFPSYVG